jgi:hypothetical protein
MSDFLRKIKNWFKNRKIEELPSPKNEQRELLDDIPIGYIDESCTEEGKVFVWNGKRWEEFTTAFIYKGEMNTSIGYNAGDWAPGVEIGENGISIGELERKSE